MSISKLEYPDSKPLTLTRHSRIAATGKGFPDDVYTNEDIIKKYDLIASDRAVQFSLGIEERRWGREETSELLLKAAKECFNRCDILPEQIDRIVYTKLVGDISIPATSLNVLKGLGIKDGIPTVDISAACSGMVHALDMGLRYIDSGDDYVLVLGGDKSSKPVDLDYSPDTRTIFLNGDGVAAILLEKTDDQHFKSSYIYTDNSYFEYSYMPFGSKLLNSSNLEFKDDLFNMVMPSGQVVHQAILDAGKIVIDKLLYEADMTIDDIDIFITCDQTHLVWKDQCKEFGIPEEKSISLFKKHGNTVAAMTPLNLNAIIESGKLKRGMTVLMTAHGAGASGGGFIFTY